MARGEVQTSIQIVKNGPAIMMPLAFLLVVIQ